MSKIGAVHFNPKIKPHPEHNDRTDTRSKNIFHDLTSKNEYSCTAKQARAKISNLYKNALAQQKGKQGKKTQKERSYHEAIFEINENTTMEQCKELTAKIAELTGFTPIQIVIHRDEGHIDNNGNFKPHYHAHALFFTLDKNTGKQLARQQASLNPKNLSKMQDLAADILQMQRGKEYFANKEPSPKLIQNQNDFKKYKQAEQRLKKELQEQERAINENLHLQNLQELRIAEQKQELTKTQVDLNKKIQKLEQGHQESINNLWHKEVLDKKNNLKNFVTFGNYHKQLEQNFREQKNELLTIFNEATKTAENEANKRIREITISLENKERELQETRKLYNQKLQENLKQSETIERQKLIIDNLWADYSELEKGVRKYIDKDLISQISPNLANKIDKEHRELQQKESEIKKTKLGRSR